MFDNDTALKALRNPAGAAAPAPAAADWPGTVSDGGTAAPADHKEGGSGAAGLSLNLKLLRAGTGVGT